MQNLAASNFPQLNFLAPMSSSSSTLTNGQQVTTSTPASSSSTDPITSSIFKIEPEVDELSENNVAGVEMDGHQQQFGMDSSSLQQLMMAAASMDQSNPMHNFYLSQLQHQSTIHSSESQSSGTNLTPSSTNPTPSHEPDSYNSMAAAAAAQQQQLLEQIFGAAAVAANNSQLAGQENNNSDLLSSSSKNHFQPEPTPNNNNSVAGFGDLNASELAQIMASLISNNGGAGGTAELLLQNGNHQKGQGQNSNGQSSNPASAASSQPVSPNSQEQHQQNPSNFFDQLQLLNLFGTGNGVSSDFFGSSLTGQVQNNATHHQLSQMSSQPMAGMGGSDLVSIAASLGLSNPSNSLSADNSNQAVAAAAALLAATSGSFSFSGSPNKSLDSYCEICDKNLCNRYFLKTHKLKKHGISDDGTTGSPIKTIFGQASFDADSYMNNASQNRAISSTSSTGVNQQQSSGVIVSAANGLGSEDRGMSGDSSPLAKMPKLSSSSSTAPNMNMMAGLMGGNGNNSMAQLFNGKSAMDFLNSFPSAITGGARVAEAEQRTPTRSPVESKPFNNPFNELPSNACDFCDKEFDSRINLLQHQIIQHGGSSITSAQNPQRSLASPISSAAATQASSAPDASIGSDVQSQLSANNFLSNLLPSGLQLPFLLPSQLSQFGGDLGEAQAALAKMSGVSTPVGTVSSPSAQVSSQQQPKSAKRQYSSTSKNYCDLCNKEVCNKYFLRTHMLKMHNIVIDENKSVIANIDTLEKEKAGSISFRCDICMLELKTRNDLRLHKRETHGVVPLLTPPGNSSAHGAQNGSITPSRTPKSATFNPSAPNLVGGLNANRLSQHQQQLQQHFFGPTSDETAQMSTLQKEQDQSDGRTEASTSENLAANVELILNSIAACRPVGEETNAEHIKKEECSEDANSLDNNIPSSSASSTFEAANSATSSASSSAIKCRFCGDHFADEIKMQLHAISNHSAEIFGHFAGPLSMLAGGQMAGGDENDVITRVALQMAQANQALNQPNPPSLAQFTCMHCSRRYKSKLSLANHTRSVHHNFVAKLSPTKRSKRPVISPKKVKKLRSCFTCMKCQRRFSSRVDCSQHVLLHLKAEKEQGQLLNSNGIGSSLMSEAKGAKLLRSNSEDKLLVTHQDSNNNSSLHNSRSLPDQGTEVEAHQQGAKSAQLAYEETFLNSFIKEESTSLEESQQLSLEMPGLEATSSVHSSGSLFDDEALLLIDEQEPHGSHDVVNQVVSEIHEEQCRLQNNRTSQPKDEKHSHTCSTPESESQSAPLSVAHTLGMNVVSPWSSLLLPVKADKQPSPSAINFIAQCNWPSPSSVSNPNVQLHQC